MTLKVLTTVDYLRGKEKEKYMSGGKITMYNMYDDITKIPSIEELELMDYATAKNIILSLKEKHAVKDLVKIWGISGYAIYHKVFKKFEVPTRPGYENRKRNTKNNDKINDKVKHESKSQKSKSKIIVENKDLILEQQRTEIIQAALIVKTGIQEVMKKFDEKEFEGFSLKLKGEFTGKQIQDRMLSLMGALIMDNKFHITFEAREIEKNE